MEAVHILVDRDRPQHGVDIVMGWQRELDEDAVNIGGSVQALDLGNELVGRNSRIECDERGLDADFGAGADLVRHIDARGGIVADEDHHQMRDNAGSGGERGDPRGGFGTDVARDLAAVEDPGAQVNLRWWMALRCGRRRISPARAAPSGR